ncbi:MAG: hypothetical protein EOQ69_15165 [Mesorhizobium sp.]|nr:MAG: hypothetical protein EOQ69_15165 [Mesorhizobium sp.]
MNVPAIPLTEFEDEAEGVRLEDFVAYMPTHGYIFVPTREMWAAASVNARIPPIPLKNSDGTPNVNDKGEQITLPASVWLDRNRPVEQMTWSPGEPLEIEGRLISAGGWIDRLGCTVFNLYRPPTIQPKSGNVDFWLNHVRRLYGDDADHIVKWLAHRVQRPHEKINHALVLGGDQGIGKDTLLEPVKQAVGPWNFAEVSPQHVLGRFNGFLKSVILRISEARDLGDSDRFAFYDHMKAYTATPPDVLRVDEKFRNEYAIPNVCGVIITTNHKADGIHLSADDRRHFVAWSNLTKEDFTESYWRKIYEWFASGGHEAVAAYLAGYDLSGFNPKSPPPKTEAFWEIVNASRAPENAELADAIEFLGEPDAMTLASLISAANGDFAVWLQDRKNARKVPHRLDECDYVSVQNPDSKQGLWRINGKRQVVYAKRSLSLRDRIAAASQLTR